MKIFRLLLAFWALGMLPTNGFAQSPEESLDRLLSTPIQGASRYERAIGSTPAAVSIVTAEEIRIAGYRNLIEALGSIRGLYLTYDRNYHYLGIRGVSRPSDYNSRLLVLIDGARLGAGGSDLSLLASFDLGLIDRIEFIRGPVSSVHGTGAVFGVVNLITKKSPVPGAWIGAASREAGEAGFTWGGALGSFELAVGGTVTDSPGRDVSFPEFAGAPNGGIAEGLDYESGSGFLASATAPGRSIRTFAFSREKGIPTAPWGTDFNSDSSTKDELFGVQGQYTRKLSPALALDLAGSWISGENRGDYPYSGSMTYDQTLEVQVGGEVTLNWDLAPNLSILAGTETIRFQKSGYRFWDESTVYFDRQVPHTLVSAFTEMEYQPASSLYLVAGVRWDEYSHADSSLNPRGALIWNPGKDRSLKLLYGTAFRVPSIYELYFEDELGGWVRNPDLKSESSSTLEAIWEERLSARTALTVAAFQVSADNLVDQEQLMYVNLGHIHSTGVEVELDHYFSDRMRARASVVRQTTEDQRTGEELSNAPEVIGKLLVTRRFEAGRTAALEAFYESERKALDGSRSSSSVRLNGVVGTPLGRSGLELQLRVVNLTDAEFRTPGGSEHVQQFLEQDGRSVMLRLRYESR